MSMLMNNSKISS